MQEKNTGKMNTLKNKLYKIIAELRKFSNNMIAWEAPVSLIAVEAFENEIEKRMGEIHFKTRTDEELWKLKDEVRTLQHKVEMLEQERNTPTVGTYPNTQSNPVYEPAPYWTNPNWKAPDITCAVPQMDVVKDVVQT